MTKKRAVTGHGNTPRGNRCKPRLSSPRISNGTHKARSRFNTVIVRRGPTKSDGRDGRTGRYRNRKRKSTAAFVFNARLAAGFTRRTRHARRPRGFFHPTEAGTAPLRPNRTAGSRSPDRHPKGSGLIVPMSPEQSHKAPCENHRQFPSLRARQRRKRTLPLSSHAKPGFQRNDKSRSLSLRLSVRNGSKISRSYCAFAMLNSIDIGSKFGIDTSAPSSSLTEICITVSVNFRLEVSSS